MFEKHVGEKKVVYDMPQLGEKEGEFYINNNLDVVTQK
jgi:hypothetical protein